MCVFDPYTRKVAGMRVGIFVAPRTLEDGIDDVRWAAGAGLSTVWMPQIFGWDALTFIAVAGREVGGVAFGTSVVPTYPRHPVVLAGQALTTQICTNGRLTLGIGLSHKVVIENLWGYSFDKPARHMREYLSALLPLLRDRAVGFEGKTIKAMGQLQLPACPPPPVLLAALAPRMLEMAGSVADGTITWMVGPKTLGSHIVPSITAAAEKAGKPGPRVVVALPVAVTDTPDEARELAGNVFSIYNGLPSYRAMLDKEGAEGPSDVAIVGDEATVRAKIDDVVSEGATEFVAVTFHEQERTKALLADLARA
jgi:F420-dependent oxidoreductase-like protein